MAYKIRNILTVAFVLYMIYLGAEIVNNVQVMLG